MDFSSLSLSTLSALPLDWIIVGVIAVVLSLETYRAGAGKSNTLAVALPLAFVCMQWISATAGIGSLMQGLSSPLALAGIFFAIFSCMFAFVYRIFFAFDSGSGSIVQAVLSGLSATAVVVIFWNSTPGVNILFPLGEPFKLLASEQYRLYVLFTSYLTLAVARG